MGDVGAMLEGEGEVEGEGEEDGVGRAVDWNFGIWKNGIIYLLFIHTVSHVPASLLYQNVRNPLSLSLMLQIKENEYSISAPNTA